MSQRGEVCKLDLESSGEWQLSGWILGHGVSGIQGKDIICRDANTLHVKKHSVTE